MRRQVGCGDAESDATHHRVLALPSVSTRASRGIRAAGSMITRDRRWSRHGACGQLRIVGRDGLGADDHGIH